MLLTHYLHKWRPHEWGRGTQECVRHGSCLHNERSDDKAVQFYLRRVSKRVSYWFVTASQL